MDIHGKHLIGGMLNCNVNVLYLVVVNKVGYFQDHKNRIDFCIVKYTAKVGRNATIYRTYSVLFYTRKLVRFDALIHENT